MLDPGTVSYPLHNPDSPHKSRYSRVPKSN